MMLHRLKLLAFIAGVGMVACAGCESRPTRPGYGTVHGYVYYQGRPLQGGIIHFLQGEKRLAALWINSAGIYSGEIPVGEASVAIETESVKFRDRDYMLKKWQEKNPGLAKKKKKDVPVPMPKLIYQEIPERYSDPALSGLNVTVAEGVQRLDFKLD